MSAPQVRTNIVGFTPEEWEQIRTAAQSITQQGGHAGLVILPQRPELYLLRKTRSGYTLDLATDEEAARVIAGGEL